MDFEFLSANLQIAYPFRDIITVSRPSGTADIEGLVAAIRAYTYDQRDAELYLDEIDLQTSDGFVTLDSAKLVLRWSDDDTIITFEDGAGSAVRSIPYGSWVVVTFRHGTEDFMFHLVFPIDAAESGSSSSSSSSGSSDSPSLTFAFEKDVDDIVILSSLVKQGPGKVQRVYIKQGGILTQIAGPGAEFTIRPGFNVEMEAGAVDDSDVGRRLTRVALNAVPGAGLGRYLICDGMKYLLTLNGAGPDDTGHLKLAPEECYWLDIPVASGPTPVAVPEHNIVSVATLEANQVRLRNACGACCSCEDYVKIYDHLRWIWDNAKAVAGRIDTLRLLYDSLVQRLQDIQPDGGDSIVVITQVAGSLLVQVSIWNDTGVETTEDIVATLDITLPGGVTRVLQQSIISGLSTGPDTDAPDDVAGSPNVTISEPLAPLRSFYWSTSWLIEDIDVDDEIIVTASLAGGMSKASAVDLVWKDTGE